jgi:hypothetical protein
LHIKAIQRQLNLNQNLPDLLIREDNINSSMSQSLADDTTIRDLNETFSKNFLHLYEEKIEPDIHTAYPESESK